MPLRKEDIQWPLAERWVPAVAGKKQSPVVQPPVFQEHFLSEQFNKSGCGAQTIGYVPNPAEFSENPLLEGYLDIYRMPIKEAGSDEYFIPAELARYADTIKQIATDEHTRSPMATHKHALLYVTRNHVHKNSFQRTPSWHRDSALAVALRLGEEYGVATDMAVHNYLVSDCIPTQVQTGAVENGYSLFGHAHGSLTEQARNSRVLNPYEIVLINDYVWHRGTMAAEGAMRNFLAVLYLPTEMVRKSAQDLSFIRETPVLAP